MIETAWHDWQASIEVTLGGIAKGDGKMSGENNGVAAMAMLRYTPLRMMRPSSQQGVYEH
jgi:hypothetical protein